MQLAAWGSDDLARAAQKAAAEGTFHASYVHEYGAFPNDHWGEVMEGIADYFRESGFAANSSVTDADPPCECCANEGQWTRAEVTISWA